MTTKIDKKITGWKVVTEKNIQEQPVLPSIPQVMNEYINREPVLEGKTYKIKPSNEQHSLYITLNSQTIDGVAYPREIFLSTKNPEHRMWMDALSLVISAVFRKGNDISFLVEELSSVYSVQGYWGKDKRTGKGKYYNSIIGEIGEVISVYLENLNSSKELTVNDDNLNTLKELLAEPEAIAPEVVEFPPNATECKVCKYKAVVLLDGCMTCLNCGDSKCG